ncbi:hypothetical protein BCR32DRAFT_264693 [Anaeromyces robustus]|uniref:Uncharacterized protein n=1 Tax=Anaeromyces robustus TaxID=1754192 RepID=A0A1Y1XMR7_9FUNG|nr:hypothetical protein BCR32DRAFT_264693 [Anaeromyces robustus]|eukprot:ORX86806.1 hypothetical protein BCR32DRAFT_264693 [Anaeromyces robustus]
MAKDAANRVKKNIFKESRRNRRAYRLSSGIAAQQAATKGVTVSEVLNVETMLENKHKKTSDIVKDLLKVNPVSSTKIGKNNALMRSKTLTKKKLRQAVKAKRNDIGRLIAKGVLVADSDMSVDLATEVMQQDEKSTEIKPARLNRSGPNILQFADPSQLSSTGTTLGEPAVL